MIITNNRASLIGLSNIIIKGETMPRMVKLLPGVNEVPLEVWEKVKENPIFQRFIEQGYVKIESETETDLLTIHHKKAIPLIENTYDTHLLKQWARDENRPAVMKAIELQLLKIDSKE